MVLFACAFSVQIRERCVSLSMCLCCVQIGFFDVSNTKQTSTTFFFAVDKIQLLYIFVYLLAKSELHLRIAYRELAV